MLYPKERIAQGSRVEEKLTRSYGNHTLAFFGLAPENLHFLTPDGEGIVNYRLTGDVAVVLGDPVCAPQAIERVTRSFLDFCMQQKWHVAFYQAYPKYLNTYRALNLHAFKMGEEAILNPQTFTLHGSALANVRTSSRRAQREGISIEWFEGVPPLEVMHQLEQVSNIWLMGKVGKRTTETGFSVGRFDELIDLAERADKIAFPYPSTVPLRTIPRFLIVVARTTTNKICAFMTFTPVYGYLDDTTTDNQLEVQNWGWTLDMMRRGPDTPPGVIELLLVRAIEYFRLCGALTLSLGLVAWADTNEEIVPLQRMLVSFVSDRLHLLETHHNLFKFKQKFHPCWESRYVVTHATLALPKVALGVFRVRNYAGGRVKRPQDASAFRFHMWSSTGKQFLRYCLVGGVNTILDLCVLNILLWCFPTHNVQVLVAYNSVAYSCGAGSSFFLNKYWTFRHAHRATWRELRRFAMSVVLEVLYSSALVWLAGKALQPFISNIPLWGNASKLVAVVIGAVLSYILMRFWTFAAHSAKRKPIH